MNILQDEGYCNACKEYCTFVMGEDNFNLLKKDLENYKRYKDIFVYSCPNCGFPSSDITSEEGDIYNKIKTLQAYKDIIDYADLKGLDKELYEHHSADIPANLYEAYVLIALAQKDYEKAIRLTYKAISLKQIMARKYRISKAELGGEEDNDDEYDKLDLLIQQSIDGNRQQIEKYYNQVENKSIFLKLLYIENLANMCKLSDAKKEFLLLIKKISISKDLKDYFNNLIKLDMKVY